ncbi:low molecular weight phosphotyrosine protein phosphatase [Chryseotalea sanaruensis]|uniref:protein-tyrosine-phosphatase n=1 Tax=Chryseotalea sanaruensis TaxID=2482724 RepID=A0A401U5N1_9BACT|nr:low molecular weight protein-tyrosine-phosphatase [Chryseotalea sanaruensis]GCC50150.1 low molecular weight phosphotyrosine protein phosphatase [Chryseotalea sanaruensis]
MDSSTTKVLFVCLGNICRSPLAEAIFKKKIEEKGLTKYFHVASCGTANYHVGKTPDPRTISNAHKNGVNIDHLGRQLHHTDLEQFDLILAMDDSNLRNIHRLPNAYKHSDKIKLMRGYDPMADAEEVPDPYYGEEQDFQNVFDILERANEQLVIQLQNELKL